MQVIINGFYTELEKKTFRYSMKFSVYMSDDKDLRSVPYMMFEYRGGKIHPLYSEMVFNKMLIESLHNKSVRETIKKEAKARCREILENQIKLVLEKLQ